MDFQHIATLSTFGAYLALLLVIGYLGDRKHSSSYEGYVSAGKSLGAWTTALSSAASSESAWAILGLSGLGFWVGLPALWAVAGCVLGFIANGLFVIVQLRRDSERTGAVTLSDYLETRLGDSTRILRIVSAVIITFFMLVYVVAQFVGAGKLMHDMEVLGPRTTYQTGVIVGATIIGLYVFFGGYAAVCWTDALQGGLMFLSMLCLPAYAIYVAGGPDAVLQSLAAQASTTSATSLLGWGTAGFVMAQLAVGLGYQGMPHMIIRYVTVRNDSEAKRAAVIAVVWSIISLSGSALLGITCRAIYSLGADGCTMAGLCVPDQKTAESVLAIFTLTHLHPILAGLVLAAICAAIMSTADSQLMYAATALVNDFWLRLRPYSIDRTRLVLITRVVVALLTIIAALVALQEVKLIYTFVLFAWGALGSAFTPVVLLSLFWNRFNRWGGLACMLTGPSVVVAWHLPPVKEALAAIDPNLLSGVFELIPASVASTLAAVVVTLATKELPRLR